MENINLNNIKGKKVLVVGIGRSGIAAIQAMLKLGADVTVQDMKKAEETDGQLLRFLTGKGLKLCLGAVPRDICSFDMIILSPGVNPELDFIQESSFESRIQILGEVCRGYHDSVQFLHFLKNDVLDGIAHTVHMLLGTFHPSSEYCVGFIEKQNRSFAASMYHPPVVLEHPPCVLLGLSDIAVHQRCHINLNQFSVALLRKLVYSFGLSSAWSAIKQTCEPLTHSISSHSGLQFIILVFLKNPGQHCDVLLDFIRKKEFLFNDTFGRYDAHGRRTALKKHRGVLTNFRKYVLVDPYPVFRDNPVTSLKHDDFLALQA